LNELLVKKIKEEFLKETDYEEIDLLTKDGFVSFEQFIHDFLEWLNDHTADGFPKLV